MPESIWVAELIISPSVQQKLRDPQHRLDPDEVRRAIVAVPGLRFRERSDPPRGRRFYVEVFIDGERVLVVLYPVRHPMGEMYTLGSAYREPRGLNAAT